jgi:hypothetical protein
MSRCSTHCPPSNRNPLLPVAVVAAIIAVAATWTVIVHVLTVLVIAAGAVAGLGVVGLAVALAMRLRAISREPWAPGRGFRASAPEDGRVRALPASPEQVTVGRTSVLDYQQGSAVPAIEQHWHLHLHADSKQQLDHVLNQP